MKDIILNSAQKKAAEHIYGSLLVLAGPGTGKTQLLSSRIANILTQTDVSPCNILCLTFTDNAAFNMRERLTQIIGPAAYDVHIATYHQFGSDIIKSYPSYFETIDLETGQDSRLEKPIDSLRQIQIMTVIIQALPYDSPLISARHYVKNVLNTISDLKRSLFSPSKLHKLAEQNLQHMTELSPKISELLENVARFPSKADTSIELFMPIFELLVGRDGLAEMAYNELGEALAAAQDTNKSSSLTKWKDTWLYKNHKGRFCFTDKAIHEKTLALANIYESYENVLKLDHLYDFDDMILRTIDALRSNDELRFNLQEKYQFILLDEFQDTNKAQFELVKQLANSTAHEGQPNIFAVGDDDQAIYAFQGALVSNMVEFIDTFKGVQVINLTENYRSHPDILHAAGGIASQIETRLQNKISGIDKQLIASSLSLTRESTVRRVSFEAEANEYSWVANQIQKLITSGTHPDEIAILAPQHKYLENIIPFLVEQSLPMSYEKRENIFESEMMRTYLAMADLVQACHNEDTVKMNELFPQVLSLSFYKLPVREIWRINWQVKRGETLSWAEVALDNELLAPHVMFYLGLGLRASHEPLEYMLDYLTGSTPYMLDAETPYNSPLRKYYFKNTIDQSVAYFEGLSNISTIREHLRTWQQGNEVLLILNDLTEFVQAYKNADQPLINTHPIALLDNSIQLMTTYKAKGLEFEHVFLVCMHDDVWGKSARGGHNMISLPPNLQYIRYQGDSEDSLRRLLFVAMTRSKHGLYLTSHKHKDNGKTTESVKYLNEYEDERGLMSSLLPIGSQIIESIKYDAAETMQSVDTMWHSRQLNLTANLKNLLKDKLDHYKMSPTHLNTFIDVVYGGPSAFLLKTLLRFPQAPGPDGEFGNAVHIALEVCSKSSVEPKDRLNVALSTFDKSLAQRYIPIQQMDNYRRKGHRALKQYLDARKGMFELPSHAEIDFRTEGVTIGDALLTGKIDRLEINQTTKHICIVDYKTGEPHTKWDKSIQLLKYKQQLYMYKFLIEGSHTWQKYTVVSARLEFVEPDKNGLIVKPLEIAFDDDEQKQAKQLIQIVWQHIKNLNLPDISQYSQDYNGSVSFINDLLKTVL